MSDRNVNPKVILIHVLIFDNNLHTVFKLWIPDKKIYKLLFVFFTYFEMQGFLTDISLLIVSLLVKHK